MKDLAMTKLCFTIVCRDQEQQSSAATNDKGKCILKSEREKRGEERESLVFKKALVYTLKASLNAVSFDAFAK